MPVAAAVVGTVAGGVMSSKASKKAAKVQAQSADKANALTQAQYDQTRADLSPYNQAGVAALGQLSDPNLNQTYKSNPFSLNGSNSPYQTTGKAPEAYQSTGSAPNAYMTGGNMPQDYKSGDFSYFGSKDPYKSKAFNFEASPDYEFRKQQGMDGIQSSAAASGGLLSGAALKALNANNSNLASGEYGASYNRYLQGEQLGQSQYNDAFSQYMSGEGLKTNQAQNAASNFLGLENLRTNQSQNAASQYFNNEQLKTAQQQNAYNQFMGNEQLASGQHQQAFNNWQSVDNNNYSRFAADNNNQYSRLMNMVNLGQNSAVQTGNAGASAAQQIGNNMMAGADSRAAGIIGSNNAYTNMIGQIGSLGAGALQSKKNTGVYV